MDRNSVYTYMVKAVGSERTVQFSSTKKKARSRARAWARLLAVHERRDVTARLYYVRSKDKLEQVGKEFVCKFEYLNGK